MSTAIVSAILVAAILIPFLSMRIAIKKHEKEVLKELSELAETQQTKIAQFEVLKDIAIGMDESKSKLFFIHKNEHLANKEIIDLMIYDVYQIEKDVHVLRNDGEERTIIDKVSLLFKSTKTKIGSIKLDLFDADYDSLTLAGELQLAEKWKLILNNR